MNKIEPEALELPLTTSIVIHLDSVIAADTYALSELS